MRLAERRTFSKPLVEKLNTWLEQQLTRLPPRGKLADAIRYALTRWNGLTRFLHDGRVELDTNPVERAIRPVTSWANRDRAPREHSKIAAVLRLPAEMRRENTPSFFASLVDPDAGVSVVHGKAGMVKMRELIIDIYDLQRERPAA
jgi:hypothetical protein